MSRKKVPTLPRKTAWDWHFFVFKGPQFLHSYFQLSWRSPVFLKVTADDNTNSKKSPSFQVLVRITEIVLNIQWWAPLDIKHGACWNSSTGWAPWHESTLTQRLHLHSREPWHFLQDKVTPLCTSVQKIHKELCQDFSKKNCLGIAGRISCWFESLWRDPNLTVELFNQPCSTEHILNPCLLS